MKQSYNDSQFCSETNVFQKASLPVLWTVLLIVVSPVSELCTRSAQAQQPDLSERLPKGGQLDTASTRIVQPSLQAVPSRKGPSSSLSALANFDSFDPVQQVGETEWPRDDINFRPTGSAVPAGDVDGDGVEDWIYRYENVSDDRASPPEQTSKSFLRFGGTTFSSDYYDQLVYRSLIPAGNLTGDEKADAIMRESESITVFEGGSGGYSELGTRSLSIGGSLVETADLDGDGFDDVIYTNGQNRITVLYGGEKLSDLEVQSYEPAFEKFNRFSYAVGDHDEDGTGSLFRVHGESIEGGPIRDDSLVVDLFGVDGARDLVVEQAFATDLAASADNLSLQLANIDGAALKEIFVQGAFEGSGTFVFQVASDSNSYNNVPVAYPNADRLIGDVNGDDRADFYLNTDNGPFIGLGPTAVENGVSPDVSVPEATGETLGFASTGPLGDLTGDGTGNVIFDLQGPSQFGYRRVGVSSGSAETADLTFSNAEYRTSATVAGTNVGDWNGDGTDDAALVRETYNFAEDQTEGTVNVYFGDPTQQISPDRTLTNPNDAQAENVAAGDFTGNGQPNLLVVWADSMPNVSLYEAGSGPSPIHTLNTSDIGLIEEGEFRSTATTAGNVGDVNGDGIDDFLIGVPDTQVGGNPVQEAFLFLGGASLPSSPDVTIDYSGIDTDPQSLASGIQGLGDINQDGIEDFAVANPSAPVFGVDGSASGKVFVHYGQEGSASDLNFDQPDEVLTPNPGSQEGLTFFGLGMASGDFNGDGIPDLATKPAFFQNFETGEGIEAVHVYFGPDFEDPSTADAKFAIPGDPVDPDGSVAVTGNVGELATVPRFGSTPRDGLLLGTVGNGVTNALAFELTESDTSEIAAVLSAFDSATGLGANNNVIGNNNRTSAIGPFGESGRLTPVLSQEDSPLFRGQPGFAYDLPAEFPVSAASADIGSDETVDFGDTGMDLKFDGVSGSGSVTVQKFDSRPSSTDGIGASNVSSFRFTIGAGGGLGFDSTEVQVAVSTLEGVADPTNVTIYKRPETVGGSFDSLKTSVGTAGTPADISDDTLYAWTEGFSEFVLASDTEPLPVELVGFDATLDGSDAVRLTWQTASETNNAGFRVQRRVEESRAGGGQTGENRSGENGESWTTVGWVDGAGTTGRPRSYRYVDADLPFEADRLAYRLKQVDKGTEEGSGGGESGGENDNKEDDSATYSEEIVVERLPEQVELLGTYPNPAQSRATVRYAVPEQWEVRVHLYNVLGQRVRTVVDGKREGRHERRVDVSGLASGVYFLRLQAGGETQTQRLTVVR